METNKMTEEGRAIYREYAAMEYEKRLGIAKLNYESSQSYARWLLASLLAMNGAALVGTANSGDKLAGHLLISSGLFFTAGLLSALVSGLYAWLNWDRASALYHDMADPKMLHGPDWNPKPLAETNIFLGSTRRKSVGAGLVSAGFLIAGLFFIWDHIALGGWVMDKLLFFARADYGDRNTHMVGKLNYVNWLDIAAAWSAIATFAIATFAYARYLYERRAKRVRLEKYLKEEKGTLNGKGQRTLAHLVAKIGMSETDIMDCAFRSSRISRKVMTDEQNKAVGILLEYDP